MNAEKMLKQQAKSILAKGNWAKSITGFLMVLLIFGIGFIVVEIAALFVQNSVTESGTVDFSHLNAINIVLCIVISVLALAAVIMMSPMYTGYVRFIARCRDNESGNIEDIFYYFSKENYVDTIQLNIFLFIKKALCMLIFFLPVTVTLILAKHTDYQTVFQIVSVWVGLGGLVGYFLFSRRYSMAEYLYVVDFQYRKESDIIKASAYMVRRNLGKIISLYFSYVLWFLFCFFVIPIVFVYPYFKHTFLLSQSYIYDIENNTPNSPYYHSNYPIVRETEKTAVTEPMAAEQSTEETSAAEPMVAEQSTEEETAVTEPMIAEQFTEETVNANLTNAESMPKVSLEKEVSAEEDNPTE